ncbi:MAG: uridine monophosphate kinase [Clostridia bacterium]|nr:uridine monophosphate kinase [Clostridia bacterium]
MEQAKPIYRRILIKLSGEALRDEKGTTIYEASRLQEAAENLRTIYAGGTQVVVVVGAGNIWRGGRNSGFPMRNRSRGDAMGMLATVINSLAIVDALEQAGVPAVAMSTIDVSPLAAHYSREAADAALNAGKVVVLGSGLGIPYVSTDTTAIVRGSELEVDMVLMAKNVDGIYDKDPGKFDDAVKFDTLSYERIIADKLKAIDLTAAQLGLERKIGFIAFDLRDPANIGRVMAGEKIGTRVNAQELL